MEIINRQISDIKPYEHNPRHNDGAVDAVARSIQEFGFLVPCVITADNVLVTGHTRIKACKKLGIQQVPCVMAENLTDEQIKAFRLADNKVSEIATWDFELLNQELEAILDIDMTDFGFEVADLDFQIDTEPKDNERLRTDDAYNLMYNDQSRTDGWFQMPIIKNDDYTPSDLIGFNYVLNTERRDCGVHFYIDDYQFERIWNAPSVYIEKLQEFEGALTPDFSLYMDMPMATKIWNVYRSRLIGQICQDAGIRITPTISWAEPETYKFCFDGIEQGATVSVSTVGVKNNKDALTVWRDGCDAMIEKIHPSKILLYGGMVDYDFSGIEIVEYVNHVTENMKG